MTQALVRPYIAHIVHPVVVAPDSDLRVAQPVTFATMNRAREFARGVVEVELFAVQYHDEERLELPGSFRRTSDLKRSVLDVGRFRKKRKLALIKDILDALYASSDAEFMIYSNVDIALQPYFYATAAAIIARGHDAFIINRRTIGGSYRDPDEIPLMYADLGEPHRGWDCFVFDRRLYPKFMLGTACIGTDWIGRMMIANMAALARNFKVFKELHATFHIGNDRVWRAGEFTDYGEHNKNECRKVLEGFEAEYGPFDRKSFPGKFLGKFA